MIVDMSLAPAKDDAFGADKNPDVLWGMEP